MKKKKASKDFLDEIVEERTLKNDKFPDLMDEAEAIISKKEEKPYTEEAHEFLKVLGKWVELKKTFPSGYRDYHEATRKFLENFKKN